MKEELEQLIAEIYFDENPEQMEWTDAREIYLNKIINLFNKRIDDSKGKIYSTIFNSDVLCSVDNVNQLTRDIINIIKKEVGK